MELRQYSERLLVINIQGDYRTPLVHKILPLMWTYSLQQLWLINKSAYMWHCSVLHVPCSERLITALSRLCLAFTRVSFPQEDDSGVSVNEGTSERGEKESEKEHLVVFRVARCSESDILVRCALSKKPCGGARGMPSHASLLYAVTLYPDTKHNRQPRPGAQTHYTLSYLTLK